MALMNCRECGKEVSSGADHCPSCGAKSPARKAAPVKAGAALGCLGVFVVLIGVGAISKSCSTASDERANRRTEAAQAALAVSQRHDDSLKVLALLATSLDGEAATQIDDISHRHGFAIDHAAAHEMAATIRLKMVRDTLRGASPNYVAASVALSAVRSPLTARQSRDSADLGSLVKREWARLGAEKSKLKAIEDVEARRLYARQYENRLLDQGIDARVTTRGTGATTLRLKYILVSKVLAHKIAQDGSILQKLRELGFKRFEITDGLNETWYWSL